MKIFLNLFFARIFLREFTQPVSSRKASVDTNIGKFFLNLVKKHFPRGHKFLKIFNKNNLTMSYSCMSNVKSLINAHNKKVNRPDDTIPIEPGCNCNNKDTCTLNQNCQASSLVDEATISSTIPNYQPKKYIGLCETTFKMRHSTHKTSSTHERY